MVWWFLWNSNLYYTAVPSTRVRNSQLDATTEQNVDLDPEWLELRTTLHVLYARRTKEHLPSTIVTKFPAWICQRAAELLKKQIASYAKTYWTLWARLQYCLTPLLGSLILGEQHTHVYTTHAHMFTTPVDSCKDSTRTQLGLGLHTKLHWLKLCFMNTIHTS